MLEVVLGEAAEACIDIGQIDAASIVECREAGISRLARYPRFCCVDLSRPGLSGNNRR